MFFDFAQNLQISTAQGKHTVIFPPCRNGAPGAPTIHFQNRSRRSYANGICAEVVQKRVQMSVLMMFVKAHAGFAPRMFFGACEHQHGTPDRTSGVLIMRNFSKRVDRVTHRKLPSGPVPEQGRRSYSCNLEPKNSRNCNRSCAEVVQNRVQVSDVCRQSSVTLIF